MNTAALIYEQILKHLDKESPIDLAAPATQRERDNLQTKVKNMMALSYSHIEQNLKDRLMHEFFASGPIEHLLADPSVTEIIINGPSHIFFERQGHLRQLDDCFYSSVSYQNFIHRLTAESRIQANLDKPFADGHWRQFRLHLITPPLAQNGAHLSLRRHPDNPWTLARFAEADWTSEEGINFIKKILHERASFLVIGPTGSGKTSVLNACLQEVASTDRVVAIEDTSELSLAHPLSVKLVARQDCQGVLRNVDLAELVRQSLRMRPDRLIMGEVRGAEAKDLLMALSTGHRGGMATLHADNARQALFRLEMLVQMGAPQWSLRAIRHLIYFGIQYVITVKKNNDGRRVLSAIHRIASLEETGFCLENIDYKKISVKNAV